MTRSVEFEGVRGDRLRVRRDDEGEVKLEIHGLESWSEAMPRGFTPSLLRQILGPDAVDERISVALESLLAAAKDDNDENLVAIVRIVRAFWVSNMLHAVREELAPVEALIDWEVVGEPVTPGPRAQPDEPQSFAIPVAAIRFDSEIKHLLREAVDRYGVDVAGFSFPACYRCGLWRVPCQGEICAKCADDLAKENK